MAWYIPVWHAGSFIINVIKSVDAFCGDCVIVAQTDKVPPLKDGKGPRFDGSITRYSVNTIGSTEPGKTARKIPHQPKRRHSYNDSKTSFLYGIRILIRNTSINVTWYKSKDNTTYITRLDFSDVTSSQKATTSSNGSKNANWSQKTHILGQQVRREISAHYYSNIFLSNCIERRW